MLAAAISLQEIEARFAASIERRDEVVFDAASSSLRGRRRQRLGAIVLSDAPLRVTPSEENAVLLAEGIARAGLDRVAVDKKPVAVAQPHRVSARCRRRGVAGLLGCGACGNRRRMAGARAQSQDRNRPIDSR